MVSMLATFPGIAHAEPAYPQLGAGCAPDHVDAMTLLPDAETYAVCRDTEGGPAWEAVWTPFDPNDTWISYGPEITLHGQGMRNPNVRSGRWLATPIDPPADPSADPSTVCRAEQETVVAAGQLSEPQVAESEPGSELSLEFLPNLFYLTLSGNCLWTRDG